MEEMCSDVTRKRVFRDPAICLSTFTAVYERFATTVEEGHGTHLAVRRAPSCCVADSLYVSECNGASVVTTNVEPPWGVKPEAGQATDSQPTQCIGKCAQ
jgi:hypothetical protein